MSYGIYDNSLDFYNNLNINQQVIYNPNQNTTIEGTVIKLSALGVKAIVIIDTNKKKYIIFPKDHNLLRIAT